MRERSPGVVGADRRGRAGSGHRPQPAGEPHVPRHPARRQEGAGRAARRGRQGPSHRDGRHRRRALPRVDRRAAPQGTLAEHRLRVRAGLRAQRAPDPRQGRRDEGQHEDADGSVRGASGTWPVGTQRVPDPRVHLVDVHPGLPLGMARHQPGAMGGAAVDPERRTGRADAGRGAPADRGRRPIEAAGVRPSDPRRRHHGPAARRAVCASSSARHRLGSRAAQGVGVDRRAQGRAAAGDPDQEPARADARPRRADVVDVACAGPVPRGAGQARPSRARFPTPTCSPTTSAERCRGSRTRCRSTSAGFAPVPVSTISTSTTCAGSWRRTARRWATRSSQVAMRAGHDPSVAARHYSGRVVETDRELAQAVASLLGSTP